MKLIHLIHNPDAGDEKHEKEKLVTLLKKMGYDCRYFSTNKSGWKVMDPDADIVLIAGGDGTIREAAAEILDKKLLDRPDRLAILPLGTANNISKALKIGGDAGNIIRSWQQGRERSFDVGSLRDVPGCRFFLESFGYGVFPRLMQEMKEIDKVASQSADGKMNRAMALLHRIILSYEPGICNLELDGKEHSGKFLMAEIMNIPFVGPNLCLSPASDPGDGELEVVLVPDHDREKLAAYVAARRDGREQPPALRILKGKKIRISWDGTDAHADDELVKPKGGTQVSVSIKSGLLNFMAP